MKKTIALALVLVMLTGLAITASAASIEIDHDKSYETNVDPDSSTARVYLAYKIFDASYTSLSGSNTDTNFDSFTYTPEDAAISYTMAADSPWVSVIKASGQTWLDYAQAADGSYVITPKTDYNSAAAAKEFADYLAANIPTGAPSSEVTVDGAAVTVDPGYYLIVAKDAKDKATRVALVTTDVTMFEKNTYMGTHKTAAQTNYKVGQEIEYTATVDVPANAALTQGTSGNYTAGHGPIILWDKMDSRLTFAGTIKEATIGSEDFADYTLVTKPSDTTRTFEIEIPVTEAIRGKTITFKYIGVINETALEADTPFVNELGGDHNGYTTKPDKPVVYTFDFDVKKVFDDEKDKTLKATFEIRTDPDDAKTAIAFTSAGTTGGYILALPTTTGAPTQFELKNGESVNFTGLNAGVYYLVEISTSAGYNLLDGPVKVEIIDDTVFDDNGNPTTIAHSLKVDDKAQEGVEIEVENHAGTVLPSTGGIGTTLFYVFGTLLVLGAGVVLVTKRRVRE